MKRLFDQNLSHLLVKRLADLFPASSLVRLLGLDQADDGQIWNYAREHGFTVVSRDADFAERSRLYGSPPKLIWLRCGNATTPEVETRLRKNADWLVELERNAQLNYLEVI